MRSSKQKLFTDEDFDIKTELFKTFPLNDLVSWSHLKLLCSITNINIDDDFIRFILTGSRVLSKLHDIMLDCIESDDANDLLDKVEFIDCLYKCYSPIFKGYGRHLNYSIPTYSALYEWEKFCYENELDTKNYYNVDEESDGLKLLTALDNKFPLLLVKFYDKHKHDLHALDESFVNWLFKRFKIKAMKDPRLVKVYSAMMNEAQRQRNIVMYMN